MAVREPITRSRSTPLLSPPPPPPPPRVCSAILKRRLTTNTGRKPKQPKAMKKKRSLRRGAKLIQSKKRQCITTFISIFFPGPATSSAATSVISRIFRSYVFTKWIMTTDMTIVDYHPCKVFSEVRYVRIWRTLILGWASLSLNAPG